MFERKSDTASPSRDFAIAGASACATLSLVTFVVAGFYGAGAPGRLVGAGVAFVLFGLMVGSLVGLLLGVAHRVAPDSGFLWPLGFLCGGVLGVPFALLAGTHSTGELVRLVLAIGGVLGPGFGLAWVLWLVLIRRERRAWPALALFSAAYAIAVLVVLIFGTALMRSHVLVGPPSPPHTSPG
jgi:hypothetical protein